MITFDALASYFTEKYPASLSCEWDNDGVMLDGERTVRKILVSLDVTPDCAAYAIENGFDAIISHHPLLFRPLKSVRRGVAYDLLHAGVGVISLHTRLDAALGGVNEALGAALGLIDLEISEHDPERILRIGNLPREVSFDELARHVKASLCAPYVNAMAGDADMKSGVKAVRRIAICGGDGKDMTAAAMAAGADAYVCGTLNYNTFTDFACRGMGLISAGHFYTENPVCGVLCRDIAALDGTLESEIFISNPVGAVF